MLPSIGEKLRWSLILILMPLLAVVFSMLSGSFNLSPDDLLAVMQGENTSVAHQVILQIRWPRTLAAMLVGALLAVAGVLMQVLLRNPLADPYVLGVSGGASVAALISLLLGLSGLLISVAAFCGALISMLLVYAIARGHEVWTPTRLLLSGVMLAAGWGALISLLLSSSPTENIQGMLFWLMGDLSGQMHYLDFFTVISIGLLGLSIWLSPQLDILARGYQQAAVLGVDVAKLRLVIYVFASLATALAVTLAGPIGFIGLIVPHIVRLVIGSQHYLLLPISAALGAAVLTVADTFARTIIAPTQLPVGVLTAFIGVPVFLIILYRGRNFGGGS